MRALKSNSIRHRRASGSTPDGLTPALTALAGVRPRDTLPSSTHETRRAIDPSASRAPACEQDPPRTRDVGDTRWRCLCGALLSSPTKPTACGTKKGPMPAIEQVPVAPGLFTWPSDDPHLIGARCADCGAHTFPRQGGCPRCSGISMEETLLSTRGMLWTWTTQEFRPKSPPYAGTESEESFTPFALGYVELPGQLKVEARLVDVELDRLQAGLEMELTIVPFRQEGNTMFMTFAFRPLD